MPNNLPDPPWRVYARAQGHRYPHWWDLNAEINAFQSYSALMEAEPWELDPHDHPHNDPEALEIIRRAKETT